MRRPTLQDRAEDLLVQAVEAGVRALPEGAAGRVGEALGRLVRAPLGIRTETVEKNLRRAFPEATDREIAEIMAASYRHLGREVAAIIRLSRLSREEVLELTEVPQWPEVEALAAEGRGCLLVTGHYGNWEVAAAAVAARGVPIDAVVKNQRNPLVTARVESARRRLGIGTIEIREASRKVPRALAAGHAIGIVADQDARSRGVFVPFFGTPASTFKGPAVFALRFDAPVFSAVARRLDDGRYRLDSIRVPIERTGDPEEDVRRLTAAVAAHLESEIRRDPSQYFWFHKRWKTPPPTEPTPGASGTTQASMGTMSRASEQDAGGKLH